MIPVLLQLHRTYFMRALSSPEEALNMRHRYAPSVAAVWLGAIRTIATVETLYQREPELTTRFIGYWSNCFSAVVALALLVSRAPFTCLTPACLQELERARIMFKSALPRCPRAIKIVVSFIYPCCILFKGLMFVFPLSLCSTPS
jgi:hypothetical protein